MFTRDGRRLASLSEHERWELMDEQAEERMRENVPYDSFRWRVAGVIRVR